GFFIKSNDDGKTWSDPEIMPAGLFGPIKNKPIRLADGRIACGSSVESYNAWTGWIHIYDPSTDQWSIRGPLAVPGNQRGLIQPTLWESEPGHVRAYLRSTREIGYICVSDSVDNGETWSAAEKTALPNPNSGIDAVKLDDGRVVLIYNHTQRTDSQGGREIIHAAVSPDNGTSWSAPWVIEDEGKEYSYPAIIQGSDGTVHVTYTWNRVGVRYVAFSREEIDRVTDGTLQRAR
ncbi:MAG TPA: neuraminidase (sialidase), partial [Firmicutes bacterium]|nr:neuraminidase (sialidase) [Bacillota bacterium]